MSTNPKPGNITILQNKTDKRTEAGSRASVKTETVAPYIGLPGGPFVAQKGGVLNGDFERGKEFENDVILKSTGAPGLSIAVRAKLDVEPKKHQNVRKEVKRSEFSPLRREQNGHQSPGRYGIKSEGDNSKWKPIPPLEQGQKQPESATAEPKKVSSSAEDKLKLERTYMHPVKLIDINFKWTDSDLKLPSEGTNHLVIGVIGKQGVGKTTLIEALHSGYRSGHAKSASGNKSKAREAQRFDTNGVTMRVSNDRMILLDCQAVLSGSVLDWMNKMDRMPPPDVKFSDNWNELQSLQLVCFLLSVCHTVLVVSEWGVDGEMVGLVKLADVLKASAPPVTDRNGNTLPPVNHVPNVVFVVNKVQPVKNESENFLNDAKMISETLKGSKLNFASGVSDPVLKKDTNYVGSSSEDDNMELDRVNLCCIPMNSSWRLSGRKETSGKLVRRDKQKTTGFKGRPGFGESLRWLRNTLVTVPNSQISVHHTEKHWLAHSQKMWELTKKSQLISEYCQFLT